jgi:hypothetical protein
MEQGVPKHCVCSSAGEEMQAFILKPFLVQSLHTSFFWSLFSSDDLLFKNNSHSVRISLAESVFLYTETNRSYFCHTSVSHTSLLLASLQFRVLCQPDLAHPLRLALELSPEISLRKKNSGSGFVEKYAARAGIVLGAKFAFSLFDTQSSGVSFFASARAKLLFREKENYFSNFVSPQFTFYSLQKWNDVLESGLSVGFVHNSLSINSSNANSLSASKKQNSWQFLYFESLPLSLRRVGDLQDTAALDFKRVDIKFKQSFSKFDKVEEKESNLSEVFWGAGIGYGILSFDNIRFSLPLPSFDVGYGF